MKILIALMFVAVLGGGTPSAVFAQQEEAAAPPANLRRLPVTPLDVQVVISRYAGEKRVSSVPYLLAVNANALGSAGESQLNMSTDVAVPTTTIMQPSPGDSSESSSSPTQAVPRVVQSYNYRPVETSITCVATSLADGTYELSLSVDDSFIYVPNSGNTNVPMVERPVFRTFRSRNKLVLRDAQTRQYTLATDRISGEVVRVEVTLRVVK